jgi:hypothetical protein
MQHGWLKPGACGCKPNERTCPSAEVFVPTIAGLGARREPPNDFILALVARTREWVTVFESATNQEAGSNSLSFSEDIFD